MKHKVLGCDVPERVSYAGKVQRVHYSAKLLANIGFAVVQLPTYHRLSAHFRLAIHFGYISCILIGFLSTQISILRTNKKLRNIIQTLQRISIQIST